ncbi:unnamed protein product [Closterium sp. NIES-65]|nr:unnamed protein product [Closterium sp. NIES-65]
MPLHPRLFHLASNDCGEPPAGDDACSRITPSRGRFPCRMWTRYVPRHRGARPAARGLPSVISAGLPDSMGSDAARMGLQP